ncbi:MAG: metallophosphoesterase family protein [Sporomusaceae bacterium]|nr:metallophosphoesterase family protein [Sporomusaceae bacterium]
MLKQQLEVLLKRKRFFLAFIGIAVLLYGVTLPPLRLQPRNVMLTWTDAPDSTQTIFWQSGRYAASGKVEYAPIDEASHPLLQEAIASKVDTDGGMICTYAAELKDLKPETTYRYRVGNGFFWSSYHTFTTAPSEAKSFKFLLFGDSQGNSYRVWHKTLRTAYDSNRDASFLINIGDLVDIGLNYEQWDDWFQAGRKVIDTIPVMAVMGNHETYTSDWKIARPLLYTAFFRLPANGPEALRGKVYSFDYGDAHFSILDSQVQEEAQWLPDMLALQQAWLEQDLAKTQKRWKLVLLHRPLYHNRPSEGDQDLRDTFAPLLDRYKVDVVFSGHDHVYARSYPIFASQWNNEQGNGTVYFTSGRSGKKTFPRAVEKDWDALFYNPVDEPNYLTIEVSKQNITVTAFSLNGDIIDAWSKHKN